MEIHLKKIVSQYKDKLWNQTGLVTISLEMNGLKISLVHTSTISNFPVSHKALCANH